MFVCLVVCLFVCLVVLLSIGYFLFEQQQKQQQQQTTAKVGEDVYVGDRWMDRQIDRLFCLLSQVESGSKKCIIFTGSAVVAEKTFH